MATILVDPESESYRLGEIMWDYLRIHRNVPPVLPGCPEDIMIMVLGSPDVSVAHHAAGLLKQGIAHTAVVSGGCALPGPSPAQLEADAISNLMETEGISTSRIIRELRSQNTSDHFFKVKMLLEGSSLFGGENPPKFVLLVPPPVSERRVLATAKHRWPSSQFWISGVPETYKQYMSRSDKSVALSRMVGEVERILTYPGYGYMTNPDKKVTPKVRAAYKRLRRDFNSRPIPNYCDVDAGPAPAFDISSLNARPLEEISG